MLKVGDKVKHKSRPDVGVGKIIEIMGNNLCIVEFFTCRFSGISLDAISTIEKIERERCANEVKIKEEQREAIRGKQDEARCQNTLKEQINLEEIEKREIVEQFGRYNTQCLWHITHKNNIQQILKHGILNHYDAYRLKANRVDISDPDAQRWRECIEPHYKRKIHEYAPLYIRPRNPMLYVRRHLQYRCRN